MARRRTDVVDEESEVRDAMDELLKHVARYRLLTFAVMQRLPFATHESPRKSRQLLRRCCDAGLLSSAALHSGTRYWYLTPSGAEYCGLEESRSGPLSETAKLRNYALLLYCCLSPVQRHRLTAGELCKGFAALARPGMPGSYYFDSRKTGSIGLARVDAGSSGRWDRIIQSVREDISLHIKLPGFRELIAASVLRSPYSLCYRLKQNA